MNTVETLTGDTEKQGAGPASPSRSDTPTPPIAVRVKDAIKLSGLGLTTLYALMGSGELPSFTVGRRRLIRYADLERFIAERASSDPEAA
jgi:excisionase family DNA binding protein